MTPPAMNLKQLRRERDNALQKTMHNFESAQIRLGRIDSDVQDITRKHPVWAIGGAAAIGLGAGYLVGGAPIRTFFKAAGLMILRPVAADLSAQLMSFFQDSED